MKVYEYIPRYTYQDYALWEGNWELIYGFPHAISPSPTNKHQYVSLALASELFFRLNKKDSGCNNCRVYQDLDWIIADDTVVRPDIMIVCGEMKGDFLTFPPMLVVEIISPSSSLRDKNIKYQLYEEQQVKYYLLLNPKNKTIEIFELVNGEYVQRDTINSFELHSNCELAFDIPAFVQQLNF